jgi:hypothetical protein
MAELWKPHPDEVYLHWITQLLTNASEPLNSWELTFVANMEANIAVGNKLTRTQADKLEQIYADKTS